MAGRCRLDAVRAMANAMAIVTMSGPLRVIVFVLVSLLWLPAGIVLLGLVRGFTPPVHGDIWLTLVPTMPCGVPLALACLMLWRTGRHRATKTTGVILGLLTILAATVYGLLGPIGIAMSTAILSLPAWLLWLWFRRRRPGMS